MRARELKLITALAESYCGVLIIGTKSGYVVRTMNGPYIINKATKLMDALVHVARFVDEGQCTKTVGHLVREWDNYNTQLKGSP